MRCIRILIVFFGFWCSILHAQNWENGDYHHPWVDSLMKTLSQREKIAQMMMVATWSNGNANPVEIENLILNHKIGGIMFLQGTPEKQAWLCNYYQQLSKIPLFVSIDGEWGLSMRLNTLRKFPFEMTLGAIDNDSLIYQAGYQIGSQCKRLGVTIDFGPVADVNTNPHNPIIGFRSFGDNPADVAHKSGIFMRGMQDAGIIAVAKHFPGHGDSETDSHKELPFIGHSRARLDSVELVPFAKVIEEGVMGVMVAHLEVPALDSNTGVPSSMSPATVTDLLKNELNFKGLVITDALNMKGVAKMYGAGNAEAAATLAGNDILLFPENVPKAIDLIILLIKEGKLDSLEIDNRIRKILYFKTLVGLHQYQPVSTANLDAELEELNTGIITQKVAAAAVTLVKDDFQWVPLQWRKNHRIAVWEIGKNTDYAFGQTIRKYAPVDLIYSSKDIGFDTFSLMTDSISENYDLVIVGIHEQPIWGKKSRELPQALVQSILDLNTRINVIPVVFGNLYTLQNIPNMPCIIMGYEDETAYQEVAARILTGEIAAMGKLPATAWPGYESGKGINTTTRLYRHFAKSTPLQLGFKKDFTPAMDSLMQEIIAKKAAPGGQVLVLKDGLVAYSKPFGNFAYDSIRPVKNSDLYDLASISKVAGTTLAAMKLYEQGKLNLDFFASKYIPDLAGTNKDKITIRQLLTHEAGLTPFIPFFRHTSQKGNIISFNKDSLHTIQISNYAWIIPGYRDTMWQEILNSKMGKKGVFLYSDLSMILLQKVIEKICSMPLEQYLENEFYSPMKLERLAYIPAGIFNLKDIAPSTEDFVYRNGTVQGFVHDPTAAMFGGVAGHAGLFSNAEELAKIFYMLENGGVYNEYRYLKPETIELFTKKQSKNSHRGLGFDKANGFSGDKANISGLAPPYIFGHSGFTGTWVWADPKNKLVFVFLSNRTYPNENNLTLLQHNFRTRAFELVYKSL